MTVVHTYFYIRIIYFLFPFLAPYVYGKPVLVQSEAKKFSEEFPLKIRYFKRKVQHLNFRIFTFCVTLLWEAVISRLFKCFCQ